MTELDYEETAEQKMNHIETLIMRIILDIIISASYKILEDRKTASENICYRSNCPMRDLIPF